MHFPPVVTTAACVITSAHALSFPSLALPPLNLLPRRRLALRLRRPHQRLPHQRRMQRPRPRHPPPRLPRHGHLQPLRPLLRPRRLPPPQRRRNDPPIQTSRAFLLDLMSKHSVGAADLVAFAASAAVATCPGGPRIRTVVGRRDSAVAAAPRLLPPGFGAGADHDAILALFRDKGFSPSELAALMGAHSVARSFDQAALPRGTPLDSTVGTVDVKYYEEMLAGAAPEGVGRLDSDVNLSEPGTTVGDQFRRFVGDQARFRERFADAMFKLSVLGIPEGEVAGLVDCTGVVAGGTEGRDVKGAAILARARWGGGEE